MRCGRPFPFDAPQGMLFIEEKGNHMPYPRTYEEALSFEKHAESLVEKNLAQRSLPRSIATLAVLKQIQGLVPAGLYRHFKGGVYQVMRTLEDVNTGLCYVEYVAQYGIYKGEPALRVLVGEDSFLRPIERDEYRGVRFACYEDSVDETVLRDV